MFANDPFGGEPMAVAPAACRPMRRGGRRTDEPPGTAGRRTGRDRLRRQIPHAKTVTIIDGNTGARRDIVIPATPEDGQGRGWPPLLPTRRSEQRLTETSRHGPLPKIAPDGTRPADAYAHRSRPMHKPQRQSNGPRVAIVIGGLGIGANGTADALRKLRVPITFAFAPYGGDLERQVARARETGHEVLLQVPMEPFDYPDNDPGPHTLLTSIDAGQNLDRLHWLMSRFQGYVGIVNYMGGRFTASEQALAPVLRETATRGLIYLDDGSQRAAWPARSPAPTTSPSPRPTSSSTRCRRRPTSTVRSAGWRRSPAPRHRGRLRRRAAGLDRPHRALGQGGGKPRHPARADHRGGGAGEDELAKHSEANVSNKRADEGAWPLELARQTPSCSPKRECLSSLA